MRKREVIEPRYIDISKSPCATRSTTETLLYAVGTDGDWNRIRDSYISQQPLCEQCYKKGVIVPGEEAHHIKPLIECGRHERDNLISLCKSCHAKIHVKSGDRWHKKNHEKTHG